MSEYIAHTREDGAVQSVAEHLHRTAELACGFARSFGAGEWAETAGLLHDIGKYSDKFQQHILHPERSLRVDHSTAGAQQAIKRGMQPVAFAVAGHHGGIPDGGSRRDTSEDITLVGRSKRSVEECSFWEQEIQLPRVSDFPFPMKNNFEVTFFTRMLYSCLVDADFLDTERFMQPGKQDRGGVPLSELHQKVRDRANVWLSGASEVGLNRIRNEILRDCLNKGETLDRGCYTLTVPTGGGKTFASLAFAMEHAARCNLERIVYVIPYTSIIDQTVEVFSKILGEENVLAHYSDADYQLTEQNVQDAAARKKAAAAENWDAPVIVTTAVQFFESLYANRPARCRKLHNLANSVIIFDEAQTLPVSYLRPCVAAIAQLVEHYRASVVLCTATQPVLQPLFDEFMPGYLLRELCSAGDDLYAVLRRTMLRDMGTVTQAQLIDCLCEQEQVLCVVNRRKQAQCIYEELPQEGRYCLTTLLCSADRKAQLREIRTRLKHGLPCRVVSTSLIEAGVDVDFPTAYREQAGLDSILQTAGRCNREGKHPVENSIVSIFSLDGNPPPRMLRQNTAALETVRRRYGAERLDSPKAIEAYFSTLLYALKTPEALDAKGILPAIERGWERTVQFPFATIAQEFRLIESPVRSVYIPTGKGAELCEALQSGAHSRGLFRKLGQYGVSVYPDHFQTLDRAGALALLEDGSAILTDLRLYDCKTGLAMDAEEGQGWFI